MKRILGFGILIVLIFNCVIVDASVISDKETEIEENVQIKDSFSEDILQRNLYEADKVKKCKDISESISVSRSIQKSNSMKMNNSEELFVENCVIVKSS